MAQMLSPSLWRTCRALANRKRLELLKCVIEQEPVSVEVLALQAGISVSTCSQWLRLLNSRGLLSVVRLGRWVYYSSGADPAVKQSEEILTAIRMALRTCRREEDYDCILKALTAFTHPRRIQIVKAIVAKGDASENHLIQTCHISKPALFRHLQKLEQRSLVTVSDGTCAIALPETVFANALLRLALAD
jgi:DNA-binding transcriptional ArsR family regulator